MASVCTNESKLSDDLALIAVDIAMLESARRKFVQIGSQFSLTVSILKTKGLAMGAVNEGDIFWRLEAELLK